ncbi:unnamed protein product [Peronospora belbahrii]|uniref:glucan endo-1,3-beta-D-glucosidase n=1 Tax=Peronospora belbahrii TaxID=622444 RepID=A0AAU9KXW8_9STRA|nr:unnamed protein product [Peronospora belbahrii]
MSQALCLNGKLLSEKSLRSSTSLKKPLINQFQQTSGGGNLIHANPSNLSENAAAWSLPYAMFLRKEAPFGLQAYYPYTYREIAPVVNGTVKWYTHGAHNDLTLSAQEFSNLTTYEIYSWNDMGVQLHICDPNTGGYIDSALVSGMAFVSATYNGLTPRISTEFNIISLDDSVPGKFVIHLNNNQTWVLYTSDKSISFRVEESVAFSVNASGSSLVADCAYSGTIRIAVLPESAEDTIYDDFVSCLVRGGTISMESRTAYSLHWDVEGSTCESAGLLHFALPHQVDSMDGYPATAETPGAILLHSPTRGLMVGQKSTTWSFVVPEADIEIDFYPAHKLHPSIVKEFHMVRTLHDDIYANWSLGTGSWYFNGKLFQKYASLCLMAADGAVMGTNTTLLKFCLNKLETLIEPLLNNTLSPVLVYETLYRGIVSRAIFDTGEPFTDFGNGIYNDHHYHFGYYVTSAAILKFLDPNWSRMPELEDLIWTMVRDVANPSNKDCYFTTFRHFSWFHGHSYSRGVALSDQGKDEESTSEDINFYYGMTMWGRVTGCKEVEDLGSLILRLNARAIRTYFLLTSDNTVHPPEIVRNHVTGIFFDNKVFYNTWFLDKVYAIHGIQMLPVLPISAIFRTPEFVIQEWNNILSKDEIVVAENSKEPWLSLLLVNAAVLDPMNSVRKLIRANMDDGLTLSLAIYMAGSTPQSRSCYGESNLHVEGSG